MVSMSDETTKKEPLWKRFLKKLLWFIIQEAASEAAKQVTEAQKSDDEQVC